MSRMVFSVAQALAANGRPSRVAFAQGILAATVAALLATAAQAAPAEATVDVGTSVECRDVSSPEFSLSHPNDKIVEAMFHVSVLLKSGREEDLDELNLLITSPERRLRVVDFRPRTEVASDLAGDVEVSSTKGTNHTFNASLGALFVSPHAQAGPGAATGIAQTQGVNETYHRLAAKQVVLASGTVEAEHGVYFKWRRSSQVALEGRREVTCLFIVPRSWRGDWVQVDAGVVSHYHHYLGKRIEVRNDTRVMAGLFLVGDAGAQRAARALSEAQSVRLATPAEIAPQRSCGFPDFLNVTLLFKSRGDAGSSRSGAAVTTSASEGADSQDVASAITKLRRLSGS